MAIKKFKVEGLPATFATSLEKEWRQKLQNQIESPSLQGRENGLILKFIVPSFKRNGHPFDVDNLCESVFSVLINKIGWFRGFRPNILWWQASKEIGENPGCIFDIYTEKSIDFPENTPFFDDIFYGSLPTSAKSIEVTKWAFDSCAKKQIKYLPTTCILYLSFNNISLNLGDIATGKIKSFIDCLYPLFGGSFGVPQDHRISELIIEKHCNNEIEKSVKVKLWSVGKLEMPVSKNKSSNYNTIEENTLSKEFSKKGISEKIINNPCRIGSAKWIVCEGALQKKIVYEIKSDLEKYKVGSGNRIKEYISDLRSENKLNIKITGNKLICFGIIKK